MKHYKQNFLCLFIVLSFLMSLINSVNAQEFIFLRDGDVREDKIMDNNFLYTFEGGKMVPYTLQFNFKIGKSLMQDKIEMINYKEKIKSYETDKNIINENYFTVILTDSTVLYALVTRVGEEGKLYKFLCDNNKEKEIMRDQLARIYFSSKLKIRYEEVKKEDVK